MIIKKISIVLLLIFSTFFCALSYADRVYSFDELYSIFVKIVNGEGKFEKKGKVKIGLSLKKIGSDKNMDKRIFLYEIDKEGHLLKIRIPTGQHYLDKTQSNFSKHVYCQGGLASSGFDIRAYRENQEKIVGILVKTDWSCGSMGCSYLLTFGEDKKLLRTCKRGR
uniref:Uncharacterized protein n=1 Tax=Candidatus Kentrum sp. TC TaxID=2126339 RepID=A0A450ZBD1_9GAMM|nr:MAG: hypothetical protein BECKTC1821D_GA0114238_11328 [Candidatus Kentron sp. TC]